MNRFVVTCVLQRSGGNAMLFDFLKPKCEYCKKRSSVYQGYLLPNDKKIKVCSSCAQFAQRRGFRKWK